MIFYMTKIIRIATINLCDENPTKKSTLVTEWITVLSKCNIDILFIQEIYKYNIEKIASELGLKLLNINNFEGTCVFINPSKLVIIDIADNLYYGMQHAEDRKEIYSKEKIKYKTYLFNEK